MYRKTLILIILSLILVFSGCTDDSAVSSVDSSSFESQVSEEYKQIENVYGKTIKAEMKIKDFGIVLMELYPEEAPITVENFVTKVEEGFYDGLKFHRIVPGFVVQGGEYEFVSTLEPIKGEFSANGVSNTIPHKRGVISMARKDGDNNSATCQFFICLSNEETISSHLNGSYAAFGSVISGMEVIDLISTVSCDIYDRPYKDVVIEYIVIVS